MLTELIVNYRGEEQLLRVHDKDVIHFPGGLVGFPDCLRFVLLGEPDEAPISVLQCIDVTEIAFLVTDPGGVCADYKVNLTAEDLAELGLDRVEDGNIICTLSAKEGPVLITANLLGPIVINPRTRVARQIVLQDSRYSAQHPVLMAENAGLEPVNS